MTEYREFTKKELKWIDRLKKLMSKAPDTLFMFVGGSSGSMYIYTKDENNDWYMSETGGVDDYAPCQSIESPIEMDGGDW